MIFRKSVTKFNYFYICVYVIKQTEPHYESIRQKKSKCQKYANENLPHRTEKYVSNSFHADFRDRQADRERDWLTHITHIWGLYFKLQRITNKSILHWQLTPQYNKVIPEKYKNIWNVISSSHLGKHAVQWFVFRWSPFFYFKIIKQLSGAIIRFILISQSHSYVTTDGQSACLSWC
jgi:hypothetical protein